MSKFRRLLAASMLASVLGLPCALAQQGGPSAMTFFVTSVGIGKGGDLGGLAGPMRLPRRWGRAAAPGMRI